MINEPKINKTQPLPNIDFLQHNSLFMTKTKLKSKFNTTPDSSTPNFNEDLKNKITPPNYFKPCYNFHDTSDKRIDINNFKEIKSDMRSLFDPKKLENQTNSLNLRKSSSKPLEKNDLKILLESNLQEIGLTQSVFERETELNMAMLDEENREARAQGFVELEEEDMEEDDLRQSFVSFLGNGAEDVNDMANKDTLNKIPNLLENVKFEKKLNFTDSKC